MTSNQRVNVCFILTYLFYAQAICEIQPLLKTGANIGYINKEKWNSQLFPDQYNYGKPLIRPFLAIGLTHKINRLKLGAAVMYQTKGQGSSVPKVRNFYQTVGPDAIHFISIPVISEYRILKKLDLSFSVQPSLYLGGVDNYYASQYWRSWIWSVVTGIQYNLNDCIDIGLEYDFDLDLYYCDGCDERFITYRIFTSYSIGHNSQLRKNPN